MKKSRLSQSQIVAILKVGEAGVSVAQLTRRCNDPLISCSGHNPERTTT